MIAQNIYTEYYSELNNDYKLYTNDILVNLYTYVNVNLIAALSENR